MKTTIYKSIVHNFFLLLSVCIVSITLLLGCTSTNSLETNQNTSSDKQPNNENTNSEIKQQTPEPTKSIDKNLSIPVDDNSLNVTENSDSTSSLTDKDSNKLLEVKKQPIPLSEAVITESEDSENNSETDNKVQKQMVEPEKITIDKLKNTEHESTDNKTVKPEQITIAKLNTEKPKSSTKEDTTKQTVENTENQTPVPIKKTIQKPAQKQEIKTIIPAVVEQKAPVKKEVESIPKKDDTKEETTSSKDIKISRSVILKRNQYLDVTYPGQGWIYLGENNDKKLMMFFGRKLDSKNTSFTLRSGKAGNTILHFYKNDLLTGNYIDDYLKVTVLTDIAETSDHVKAPDYADIVPPAPKKAELMTEKTTKTSSYDSMQNKPNDTTTSKAVTSIQDNNKESSSLKTAIQDSKDEESSTKSDNNAKVKEIKKMENESGVQQDSEITSNNLLDQAKQAYTNKSYKKALDLLSQYFETATENIDEALYLQGEIYEKKSDVQDIRSAIASYNEIVENWPESKYWSKAKERSIYLTRFYINIR